MKTPLDAVQGNTLAEMQREANGRGGFVQPHAALQRVLLANTGLSLSKLARKSGLSPSHLSRILTGKRVMGKGTMQRLEKAGLPVHLLLNRCLSCGQQLPDNKKQEVSA